MFPDQKKVDYCLIITFPLGKCMAKTGAYRGYTPLISIDIHRHGKCPLQSTSLGLDSNTLQASPQAIEFSIQDDNFGMIVPLCPRQRTNANDLNRVQVSWPNIDVCHLMAWSRQKKQRNLESRIQTCLSFSIFFPAVLTMNFVNPLGWRAKSVDMLWTWVPPRGFIWMMPYAYQYLSGTKSSTRDITW